MDAKTRKLLEWLHRKECVLEEQIIGSGLSSALNDTLASGLADMCADPTVKVNGKFGSYPAASARITDAGRRALAATMAGRNEA